MGGIIALSPDTRWSVASWLYEWVARFIVQHVDDPGVAAKLQEVIDENLGWVEIPELPSEVRRTILEKLRNELVPAAESQLPATLPDRQGTLELIRKLAELACEVPDV